MTSQLKALHDQIVIYIESKGFEFLHAEDSTQTFFMPEQTPAVYILIYEDCDITVDREGFNTVNISKDHIAELHTALSFIK